MEQAPVQRIKYPGSIKKDDAMKDNYTIAQEVISGLWGNGTDRKSRLIKAGYNYENIQSIVNAIMDNNTNQPAYAKITICLVVIILPMH